MGRRRKNLKLPNSYGSVLKMSNANRRRRPYMVRITTGYEYDEETGRTKQKRSIIGYAKTREEGLQMLARYHDKPYDLERGNPSFREVYQDWFDEKFQGKTKGANGYRAAYNSCYLIYEYPFRDIRTQDLQRVIDTCGKNYPTLKNIRILFTQLYGYAIKNDLCATNYARYVDISKHKDRNPNRYDRQPFTKEQIDVLWSQSDDAYVQMILIMIYTGVRVSELLDLKKEDVDLDEHYFNVIRSKTKSGIRKVPISDPIYQFFRTWYASSDCEYVFHTPDQKHFLYRNYYDSYFNPFMERMGYPQTPHCCRHTCISLMAEAQISPTYQKMIIGHKGAMSLTESVYTHIDIRELIKAVNSVYYPKEVLKKEQNTIHRPRKKKKEMER